MSLGFEIVALTVPMAMAMGLAFGAGPCNITCLPYLGPVFVANQNNPSQAWRTVLPFSAGRLFGYAGLGLTAGMLGQALESWLASPVVGWVLGAATMAVGLSLLLRRDKASSCNKASHSNTVEVTLAGKQENSVPLPGGLFVMGAGMALNPCAPLATILVAASATGSAMTGMSLGLGFGIGAIVIPAIVFAIGVAHFGRQLREHMVSWRSGLEVTAAVMLILLGLATILGWIRP